MALRRTKLLSASLLLLSALAGCGSKAGDDVEAVVPEQRQAKPQLGLMTSLPLYWPEGAGFGELASGQGDVPWQRLAIERGYSIVPLDTLSPIPGLSPDEPEIDPLAGLERLAVIQPRGLSPADNVALDEWVRSGGHLLLVLDPMLTGHYEFALGDPRRPSDVALIPPVVARWGLSVSFDEQQPEEGRIYTLGDDVSLRALEFGEIAIIAEAGESCRIDALKIIAQCDVGEGQVTLLADASPFEHEEFASLSAGDGGRALLALLEYPFENLDRENYGN